MFNIKNRAESILASGINDSVTELVVGAGEGALFPATNFLITIDDEILLCSSRTTDTLTVTRAQEDTAAAAHSSEASVQLRITAGIIEELQTADAQNVKLTGNQTVNGIKTLGSIPVGPASDPTADNELARKAYVDTTSSKRLTTFTTDVDIADTNEATVMTVSVPANTLGTVNAIRGRIYIDDVQNTNTGTITLKLKYGGTTIATATTASTGTGDGHKGFVDFTLFANGASAQDGSIAIAIGTTALDLFAQVSGTSSEDSTGALTLAITAQRSGAGSISFAHGYAEIIS